MTPSTTHGRKPDQSECETSRIQPIARIKIYPEEFEKTPKKSIKRFLYQEVK